MPRTHEGSAGGLRVPALFVSSLHVRGMAIDIRVPGCPLNRLRGAAVSSVGAASGTTRSPASSTSMSGASGTGDDPGLIPRVAAASHWGADAPAARSDQAAMPRFSRLRRWHIGCSGHSWGDVSGQHPVC